MIKKNDKFVLKVEIVENMRDFEKMILNFCEKIWYGTRVHEVSVITETHTFHIVQKHFILNPRSSQVTTKVSVAKRDDRKREKTTSNVRDLIGLPVR